jgi:hypothetical protein
MIISAVNKYGFMQLFPLIAVFREWVILAAQFVFAVALVEECRQFAKSSATSGVTTP